MEWDFLGQVLFYVVAAGIPTTWLLNWLYRMRRRLRMPTFVAKVNQMRRRDAMIRATRDRTTVLETIHEETEVRLAKTEIKLQEIVERMGKTETMIAQIRQKLRSRGIATDA